MTAVTETARSGTANISHQADHGILEANSGPHLPSWLLIVLICLYLPCGLLLLLAPWHSKA